MSSLKKVGKKWSQIMSLMSIQDILMKSPDEDHQEYWSFSKVLMAYVASNFVGPSVTFQLSKLNFKWYDNSDTFKWYQDIRFFPHTNYNVLTIGCYLEDTDMNNGPLAVLKASHQNDLYDQYDKNGGWTGMSSDEDGDTVDMSMVDYLNRNAGSITINNARALHFSP